MDREISNEFQKILTKQGIKFKMGSRVDTVKNKGGKVLITYTDLKKSKKENIEVDKVLVSVGRKPYTKLTFFPSLEKELFIKVVQFCDSLIPNPAEMLSPKIKSFLSSAMIELEKIKTKINNFLYLEISRKLI